MRNLILALSIISFAYLFISMLIKLRKFEIENKKLRIENAETKWNQIKI
jgi:hypothetical protein